MKILTTIVVVILALFSVLTCLLSPILSWMNYKMYHLQTSYFTLRYIWMFFYILFNILINVFPLVNNFLFFMSDGIILSQLTTLYMYNEFSMSCFLTIIPVLFVIQNHHLIRGIANFAKDENK